VDEKDEKELKSKTKKTKEYKPDTYSAYPYSEPKKGRKRNRVAK